MEQTVSVVIPAYNAMDHLPRALESALAQTRPAQEIVVVDDGSSDSTAEVARGYGAPVRLVSHAQNRGLSAARNTGVRAAHGRWIALLDADDVWYPPKLERQMRRVEAAPDAAGVHFCLTLITMPDGQRWVDCVEDPDPEADPAAFRRTLLVKNAISGSGCSPLVRRDLLMQVGGWDETLRTCEDWDLWLRLAPHTRFSRLDQTLCEGFARADGLSLKLGWILEDAGTVLRRNLPALVRDEAEAAGLREEALSLIRDYVGSLTRGAA